MILVTGAGGFIGSHVVSALRADGHEVRCSAVRLPGSPGALDAEIAGCDAVVHLAGRAHVTRRTRRSDVFETNVLGTEQLGAAAVRARTPLFLFISSVAARSATTPYGRSKRAAEQALAALAVLPTTIVLRPPMVYGEGMKGTPLRLFSWLIAGWPLPVPAASARRSVLYVGNLAAALAAIVRSPRPGTWELADGPAASAREFVRLSAQALGRPAHIIPVSSFAVSAAGRIGGALGSLTGSARSDLRELGRLTESITVDPARFNDAFRWCPPYSTIDGLSRTAAWYRSTRAHGA